ncbi:TPA: AMP-binding protein, partial [Klebsiella pneumoniae]|nr:AMP-binding protein [Klebsiella pneumoniae]
LYSAVTHEALMQRIAVSQPVLLLHSREQRGRKELPVIAGRMAGLRVVDTHSRAFGELLARHRGSVVPCTWLAASAPSHLLFTSGTTGTPKGIVRDTGGYAVALLASLAHLFRLRDDEIFFTTADAGWVTGHSYGIYGPLLAGLTTVLCEVNSPGEYWWQM